LRHRAFCIEILKLSYRSFETEQMMMALREEIQAIFPKQEGMFRAALHHVLDQIRQQELHNPQLSGLEDDGLAAGRSNKTGSGDALE
jgi:hypothetical protein